MWAHSISPQRLVSGAIASLAALFFILLPPIEVAGLSLWFYLIPALMAIYFLPLSIIILFFMIVSVAGYFLVYQVWPSYVAESLATLILLSALSMARTTNSRINPVLMAVLVLLFIIYPLVVLINYFIGGLDIQSALLLASNFSINGLMSVMVAEVLIVAVAFSQRPWLQRYAKVVTTPPSLLSIVEFFVGFSTSVSILLMLTFYSSVWDRSINKWVADLADSRFHTIFSTAELSVEAKLAELSSMVSDHSILTLDDDALADLLALYGPSVEGANSGFDLAVRWPAGEIVTTSGISPIIAERSFSRARADKGKGFVTLDILLSNNEKHPAFCLLTDDSKSPELLLVFSTQSAANHFSYSDALSNYDATFSEPVTQLANARQIAAEGTIISELSGGGLLWRSAESQSPAPTLRTYSPLLDESVVRLMAPSAELVLQFGGTLHNVRHFSIAIPNAQYYGAYVNAINITVLIGLSLLTIVLAAAHFFVARLIQPLQHLTDIFENWRQFRGEELGSDAALKALDEGDVPILEEWRGLQLAFRALVDDIVYGERRVSTIAANYDELLRSLPLGVLAIDGASRVQFLNDALGEIIEQRQAAISALKIQAAKMLANNATASEWQLDIEGRPPKNLLLVVNHRLDDRGKESGLWIITTDLTQQKLTNAQLIQASKLATLGEMSTGMAHELNQPLNVISLAANNLRFSITKGKSTPETSLLKLDRIDGAVNRAAGIIDHMRSYGRLAGSELSTLAINDIINDVCDLLSEQLKLANISLTNNAVKHQGTVKGNAIQLEQVLINIINNAKDAIRDSGTQGEVTIASEVSGRRILIRVTDNGGGIPEDVLPRIFEPFYTTKAVGKGTGLGGSISYGIVREMQGDMWAENVFGGAQITISLPLVEVS